MEFLVCAFNAHIMQLIQIVPCDFVVERAATDTEEAGGLQAIVVGVFERAHNYLALDTGKGSTYFEGNTRSLL